MEMYLDHGAKTFKTVKMSILPELIIDSQQSQ